MEDFYSIKREEGWPTSMGVPLNAAVSGSVLAAKKQNAQKDIFANFVTKKKKNNSQIPNTKCKYKVLTKL